MTEVRLKTSCSTKVDGLDILLIGPVDAAGQI